MFIRGARANAALLVLCLTGCNSGELSKSPDDPEAFFKGKTMTYIVAAEPGGGYDTYGRLVSHHLGKRLGLGRIIVKNVPGGAHYMGTNEIYAASPDGLTLGTFNSGLIYARLLKLDGLNSDFSRMSWIGKAGDEPRLLTVSKKSGYRSLEDIRKAGRPLLLGATGVGNAGYNDAMLLARALGLRIKPVFGLSGRESLLSMLRGETDGDLGSASSHRQFVKNGYGYSVMRVGHGEGVDDAIPDASTLVTTAEGRVLVDLVRSVAALTRWTAGPPGIPADRVAVLRAAYDAAISDPALVAEARKLDIPIVPMDGRTLAEEVNRVLNQPSHTVALIASILGVELKD